MIDLVLWHLKKHGDPFLLVLLSPLRFSLSPLKASLPSQKVPKPPTRSTISPHNRQPPPPQAPPPTHLQSPLQQVWPHHLPMVRLPPHRRRLLPNPIPRMLHQKRCRPRQRPRFLPGKHIFYNYTTLGFSPYGEHWHVRGRRTEGGGGGGKGGGFEVAARKTALEPAPLCLVLLR